MEHVAGSCEECGDEMQGRSDRKFCSSACRQKAYRNNLSVKGTSAPFVESSASKEVALAEGIRGSLDMAGSPRITAQLSPKAKQFIIEGAEQMIINIRNS